MRTLLLMRHAKSSWREPRQADHDRPLNARGRAAAPRMAEHLVEQRLAPDVILASSAVRVQETLELMREKWPNPIEVFTEPHLYLATPNDLGRAVEGLHDSWNRVMIVGHNPGLSIFATWLTGSDVELPTAAVAVVQRDVDHWLRSVAGGGWQLRGVYRPRELE